MKFEYKIVPHTDIDERTFDGLGRDGWELVTVMEVCINDTCYSTAFFKRRME